MADSPRRRLYLALVAVAALVAAWLWLRGDDGASKDGDVAQATASGSGPRGHVDPRKRTPLGMPENQGGSISGRITATDGSPIKGADVCAATRDDDLSSAQRREPHCVRSGPDGAYRLEALYRVRWTVSAAAHGHIPNRHGAGDPKFLGVRVDQEKDVAGVDIVLEPGGVEIAGIVKDLSGGVVEDAFVTSSGGGIFGRFSGALGAVTRTDADGKFKLWVEEGKVSVAAQADGYAKGRERGVAPGVTFTVILTPESVIAGVVRDPKGEPVAGAKVSASASWFSRGGSALSGDDGRYRIAGLEAGRYKPTATAAGAQGQARESVRLGIGESVDGVDVIVHPAAILRASVTTEEGEVCPQGRWSIRDRTTEAKYSDEILAGNAELKAVRPGHYEVTVDCKGWRAQDEYPPIDVAEENITDLRYTVVAGRTLRGVVVDSDDKGVADASVNAARQNSSDESGSGWTKTDASGAFELAGLSPGSFKVSVWAEDLPDPKDPVEVDVPETGDAAPLRIVLERPGIVRGHVSAASGEPVSGVTVRAKGGGWASAHVADDGEYKLEGLRAGSYRITAQGARWSDTLRKPGTTDDDVQGEQVDVVAGETHVVDLVVEARDGEISGTVVDEASGPLGDAYVAVSRESDSATAASGSGKRSSRWNWGTDPILTDVDGTFTATGLADGQYTVRAYRKGGGEGFVEGVAVGAGSVEIQIAVEGSLSGAVTLDGGGAPQRFKVTVSDGKAAFRRSEDFARTEGAWAMRELPAGTFDVVIAAAEGTAEHKGIELAAGAEVDGLASQLAGRTTIRGRVVDLETGEPVPRLVVRAFKPGASMQFSFGQKRGKELTGDDGRYTLENAPTGKLTLRVTPSNFADRKTMGTGSLFVDAKPGEVLDAPDLKIVPRKTKSSEQAGDLGYKLNEREIGAEPGVHPRVVGFVRSGGPAEAAGLEVGGVIVKVDGHDVAGANVGLYSGLTRVPKGTTVELELEDGKTVRIKAGPPV